MNPICPKCGSEDVFDEGAGWYCESCGWYDEKDADAYRDSNDID